MHKLRLASFNELSLIVNIEQQCNYYAWGYNLVYESFMSGSQFFLHESNAGYYCVKLIDDIAEFLSIGVSPQLQGQGIGFVMCSHMIEHCKINGVQKIFLEVSVQNFKAISLYKKLGFFVIDLRKQYYNDGMDAYTMQLTLGLF